MGDPTTVLDKAVKGASVTRAVMVEQGALAKLPGLLASLGQGRKCQIVADPNTMTAAAHQVIRELRSAGIAVEDPIVLTESPRLKPRAEAARALSLHLKQSGALPIAVGSGVLNDITKYAAEVAGLSYASVATAASMDGYAASGAAMLEGGFKQTLPCAPPIAVLADLDILAKAPARMGAWGYSDLAGKVTAGADWILADALAEEPLDGQAFALVQDNIRSWLSAPEGIARGDAEALRGLMDGLLVSGFAMQAYGNSRPASGSEHQISHVWEMERLTVGGEPAAHGACVGVATVAILALYEWFLGQDVATAARRQATDAPPDPARVEAEVVAAFADPGIAASARTEMAAKMAVAGRRRARLTTLAATWPTLRERLAATLVPPDQMETWLEASGAAAHPNDLAVPLAKLARDYRRARLIRRRYTILDCLDDLGWLDRGIEALFARDGFWGRRERGAAPKAAAGH